MAFQIFVAIQSNEFFNFKFIRLYTVFYIPDGKICRSNNVSHLVYHFFSFSKAKHNFDLPFFTKTQIFYY